MSLGMTIIVRFGIGIAISLWAGFFIWIVISIERALNENRSRHPNNLPR